MSIPNPTATICDEILVERQRQDDRWGEQNHPDGTGPRIIDRVSMRQLSYARERAREVYEEHARKRTITWRDILLEEVYEALAEGEPETLRAELIQVAAVAAAWAEAIDRRIR